MNISYLYLAIAIVAEVAATSALKASEEFTKLGPSLFVIGGYIISFYCLALALRTFPIGIAYAIWTGIGVVVVTLLATYFYKEIPDTPAILGMLMIIAGVVVIHLFSKTLNQ